ncbi:replication protein A 70 kDa DNA-binding subunit-like [Tetranychus urticae]|uniref:Replication protein A 70 kDa DNA-binding subunit n=1 Tax=Tetranychus urticae TaxID=32264 RepID=T1KSQ9_TETUR|nr:replication protein A 70 kDa DNA-binding subunit-like [Tetranychus urticae]
MICPIAGLHTVKRNWKICGKVVAKSELKTWENDKTNGKFFNFVIADSTSCIKAIAFNSQCEKIFPIIKINAIYYISNGTVKETKKQFMELKNPYEIHLYNNAQIEIAKDAIVVEPEYNFMKIADLTDTPANELINIKCVVKHIETLEEFGVDKISYKRNIALIDDSESEIKLTLWNEKAKTFACEEGSVIMAKRLKVVDYNGKNLLALDVSNIKINPDIPESPILKAWFFDHGRKISKNCLTLEPKNVNLQTLKQISISTNAHCQATVVEIKACNFYSSCPDGCNKKLIEDEDGFYKFDTCDKVMMEGNQKLVLKVKIVDFIATIDVAIYSEIIETLTNCKCEQLSVLEIENRSDFEAKLHECILLNVYTFDIRIKMVTRDGITSPDYIVNRMNRKTESPYQTINAIKNLAKDLAELKKCI